ncbi:helix-turn-helix protein [Popillia japonica]|uniref:Helix-turn-helix protein n=1 Tax=Popillia japonica TaxID=7064 RepID=A0AAW1HSV2_POPJA
MNSAFCNRLKKLRKEKGWSQEKAANKIGVSRGAVSYYEKGDRAPDIDTLLKVAAVFNASADYLLGLTDTKNHVTDDKDRTITRSRRAGGNMNELIKDTSNLTPIEIALGIDTDGRTTATKLHEFLQLNPSNYSKWFKKNIMDNEFAEENVDFTRFVLRYESATGTKEREDAKLTARFAKKLSMMQKNERGEEAREYFTRVEDKTKEIAIQMQNMSPELRLLINMELEQKRQALELSEVKEQVKNANDRVESIREVVALDTTTWRDETRNLINKVAQCLGGGTAFRQVRAESYELLEKRMGVNLQVRLTNKRRRMAEEGTCKSKRDKLTMIDIIAEEPDKKFQTGQADND